MEILFKKANQEIIPPSITKYQHPFIKKNDHHSTVTVTTASPMYEPHNSINKIGFQESISFDNYNKHTNKGFGNSAADDVIPLLNDNYDDDDSDDDVSSITIVTKNLSKGTNIMTETDHDPRQ